jgi:hypothetical protein
VLDQILEEALLVDADSDTRAFPYVRPTAFTLSFSLCRSLYLPIRSVLYRHVRLEAYSHLVRLAASLHRLTPRRSVGGGATIPSPGTLIRTVSLVMRTLSDSVPSSSVWHLLALLRACPRLVGMEFEFLDLDAAARVPAPLLAFGLRTLNRLTHVAVGRFPDITDFSRYRAFEALRSSAPALRRMRLCGGQVWPERVMPPVPPTAIVPLVARNANLVELELVDVDLAPHVLARWIHNLPLRCLLLRPTPSQPQAVLAAVSPTLVHLDLALPCHSSSSSSSSPSSSTLSPDAWRSVLASFPRLGTLVIDGIAPSPVDDVDDDDQRRPPGPAIRLSDLPPSLTKLSLSFSSWEAAPSESEWLAALQDRSWLPRLGSLVVRVDDTTDTVVGGLVGETSSSLNLGMRKLCECCAKRNVALPGSTDFARTTRRVPREPVVMGSSTLRRQRRDDDGLGEEDGMMSMTPD